MSEWGARRAAVREQPVREPQLAAKNIGHVIQYHHEKAQVLVVHEHLHQHGQHAQQ